MQNKQKVWWLICRVTGIVIATAAAFYDLERWQCVSLRRLSHPSQPPVAFTWQDHQHPHRIIRVHREQCPDFVDFSIFCSTSAMNTSSAFLKTLKTSKISDLKICRVLLLRELFDTLSAKIVILLYHSLVSGGWVGLLQKFERMCQFCQSW